MSDPTPGRDAREFKGRSVEEAVAEALRALNLREEEAVVEVIQRGSRGLFGIGSEPAVVLVGRRSESAATVAPVQPREDVPAPRPPVYAEPVVSEAAAVEASQVEAPGPEAPAAEVPSTGAEAPAAASAPVEEDDAEISAMASEMFGTVVRLMGFPATVTAEWRDADAITDERHLLLSARGQNLSSLIGRRGETLDNLQYLLRLMVNQKLHRWLNIIVDVEDYRAKRVEHLTQMALRMAEQVADTGRSFALEPMPPNERRIIHLALRDHPAVFTESTGDSERRKVNIFPRK